MTGATDAGRQAGTFRPMKPPCLGRVAARSLLSLLSVSLVACGGDGGAGPDAPPAIDAAIDASVPTLTVTRTGAGTVTSAPAGIDCGATCTATFTEGAQVTLTATPGLGATFTGWTGACSGTGSCVVTVSGAVQVGAGFAGGCMDECPAGGSECLSMTSDRTCGEFDSDPCREWGPSTPCTGTELCTLGRCGAQHQLSVLPLPEAAVGTVTSSPDGITCGLDGRYCQHDFADGTQVTLTATTDAQAVFAGWSLVPLGDMNAMHCVGSLAPCTVTMDQVTSVAATYCTPECPIGGVRCSGAATNVIETCGEFDGDPCTEFNPTTTTCGAGTLCTPAGCRAGFVVTAGVVGDGAVAIDGVTCAAPPCRQGVVAGGSAHVTAIAGPAAVFTGWTGACTGSGACTVTAAGTVTAHFADRCVDDLVLNTGGFAIEGNSLAVGSELWIGEDGGLYALFQAPLDGSPATLATFNGAPMWGLSADATGPYWMEGFSTQFDLARFVGGARQVLVPGQSYGAIAVGATDVFYLQGTRIMKVAKTGGTPVMFATVTNLFSAALAVDDTSVYWFGDSVLKFPIGGGAPVTLVAAAGGDGVVAQDATHLYWARRQPVPSAIVRVAKAGGPVEPLVPARDVLAIAVSGTTVAWLSSDQPPHATTIGSGVVTQLGRRPANWQHSAIAITAGAVYATAQFDATNTSPVISRLTRTATCLP